MRKRGPEVDWQMLEENAEWPPDAFSVAGRSTARRGGRRQPWWVLGPLLMGLLLVLVEGYRVLRSADQAIARVENEVRAAVAADEWMQPRTPKLARTNSVALLNTAHAITPGPELEVGRLEVRGGYAMVEVWTSASDFSWLPASYRQTRFYQETEQGWLPTVPSDVFWQPLASLKTGRFTFVYGPRDADAVLEAARQVEGVDANLRAELGLPPTDEVLNVKLVATVLPSLDPTDLARLSDGVTLYAPSPALLPLPASISEGDALLQLVAGLLTQRNLQDALGDSEYACEWQFLANGLSRWWLWEHSELASQSRYDAERLLRKRLGQDSMPNLDWLRSAHGASRFGRATRSACASYLDDGISVAFVDYSISVYGHDRLPALIAGMKRYDTWEDLILAVYGVSAADFEAGWQDYLKAIYSSSPAQHDRDE